MGIVMEMDTPLESSDLGAVATAVLENLRAALTQLRALAAQPSADPVYAHAAEQVEAIVVGLQSRASPATGLVPEPPGGLFPDPPSPG